MKLIPNSIEMKSETLLSQFFITGWKLEYKTEGGDRDINQES